MTKRRIKKRKEVNYKTMQHDLTGTTSGAGNIYPSGTSEFTGGF
jgi:hypothetical protein